MDRPFQDVQFMTAAEKSRVFRHWKRLVFAVLEPKYEAGLPKGVGTSHSLFRLFPNSLYEFLHLHCGFIAHYNRLGFFETYFAAGGDDLELFFNQFDRRSKYFYTWCAGDYRDIFNAMMEFLEPFLPRVYARAHGCQALVDVSRAKHLAERHGYRLTPA